MKMVTKEMAKRDRPTLAEDEYTQMQYVIGEAIELQQRVRVMLYHPYEEFSLMGLPIFKGNKLYLQTDEGSVPLEIKEIVRIEPV